MKSLLYEMLKGLKKKMKTIINKMAKNTNLSTIESKKQTKLRRRTETETWIWDFDGCQVGGGCSGMGEEVRGLRSTNW